MDECLYYKQKKNIKKKKLEKKRVYFRKKKCVFVCNVPTFNHFLMYTFSNIQR